MGLGEACYEVYIRAGQWDEENNKVWGDNRLQSAIVLWANEKIKKEWNDNRSGTIK